jgi:hypothetical protein
MFNLTEEQISQIYSNIEEIMEEEDLELLKEELEGTSVINVKNIMNILSKYPQLKVIGNELIQNMD